MSSLSLWARDGEAVRQAIELGEIAHIETASEELLLRTSKNVIKIYPIKFSSVI